MRPEERVAPSQKRLLNGGNAGQRHVHRNVEMRDAAFAMLRRRPVVVITIVVVAAVPFVVMARSMLVRDMLVLDSVVMLAKRPVKRNVDEGHQFEANQP